MQIDLMSDLKTMVEQELSNLGYSNSITADLDTVLLNYFNVINRLPAVIKWDIKQSKEVKQKIKNLPIHIKQGVENFIHKAESGQDLRPHLSKRIKESDAKDLMFYDWEIFHFHLGIKQDENQPEFVERTNELLFSIVKDNTMYLIDIYPHQKSFRRQKLLEIIENNWCKILDQYTVKGDIGSTHTVSDNGIDKLRDAGITIILKTPGGRVLTSMGSGITTAKTSVRQRLQADELRMKVAKYQRHIIQQPEDIKNSFQIKFGKKWSDLIFKLSSFTPKIEIKEMTTGKIVAL